MKNASFTESFHITVSLLPNGSSSALIFNLLITVLLESNNTKRSSSKKRLSSLSFKTYTQPQTQTCLFCEERKVKRERDWQESTTREKGYVRTPTLIQVDPTPLQKASFILYGNHSATAPSTGKLSVNTACAHGWGEQNKGLHTAAILGICIS